MFTGPLDYVIKTEILTIIVIASFVTWKFFNSIYDNILTPLFDGLTDNRNETHYIHIYKKKINVDMFVTEFIKWIFLISIICIVHIYFMKMHGLNPKKMAPFSS